ncbi:hypothetical protein C8R45DRAFT_1044647 [Mycena sanguinolenta]|nr:hypothetical protein C8R45DRAFT_1044647 [Mycena sanguinolenta]
MRFTLCVALEGWGLGGGAMGVLADSCRGEPGRSTDCEWDGVMAGTYLCLSEPCAYDDPRALGTDRHWISIF